jgi:hypothetical protein
MGVIRDPEQDIVFTHTGTLRDDRRARWVTPSGIRIFDGREAVAAGEYRLV